MKNLILISCLLFLFSCTNYVDKVNVDQEIKVLQSDDDLKVYLENLYNLNERTIKKKEDIFTQKEATSPEGQENLGKMAKAFAQNVERVEKVFAKFGHPQKAKVGRKASNTPIIILQYVEDYEYKKSHLKILKEAYHNGDVEEDLFAKYLNDMHDRKFGEPIIIQGRFKEKDRIEALLKKIEEQ